MPKVIHISVFSIAICISFVKMDRNQEFPASELEVFNASENMRHGNGTFIGLQRAGYLEDEDDFLKILIVGKSKFRSASSNKEKLWENGIVPYEISNNYNKENRDIILNAMEEFHNKTCVQFRPRKNESSYILIMPGVGCSAGIGRVEQQVNNVHLHQNCFVKGIVLHELMHTLGFIHEQNRPDRDNYVRIEFDNIKEGAEGNFKKFSPDEVTSLNQSYDYGSVLHYGKFDFAKDKSKPTIIPREEGAKIGQREGFSEKDLIKINLLYNCDEKADDKMNGTEENTAPTLSKDTDEDNEREKGLISNFLFYFVSKYF